MALFIVSCEIRLHVEAPDAQTAQAIAYDVLAPSDFDVHGADENDALRFDSTCRPWTLDARGHVKLSARTCDEIVEATMRERDRLEQEQEVADA